ncbi:MAG TPA: diacylglycerol kinase family protein [Desulfitobacteriaceae bacterium]|nr:diacylglycerol kinase family protein [Desulfitobacteriaceae bacterium]
MGNAFKDFGRSVKLAWHGLKYTWKTQSNMRFHGFAAAVVLMCAWASSLVRWEWLLLLLTLGCVFVAEVLNTAIEIVVNLVEPHFHPLAGIAKDVAAGAVLIAALQAVVVGVMLFYQPLWHFLTYMLEYLF